MKPLNVNVFWAHSHDYIGTIQAQSGFVPRDNDHMVLNGESYCVRHVTIRNELVNYMHEWRIDVYVVGGAFGDYPTAPIEIPQSDGIDEERWVENRKKLAEIQEQQDELKRKSK